MFDLTGKKALVTGSSQGIGKELARALVQQGATVYIHGSEASEKLDEAKAYTGAYKAVTANFLDSGCAERLYEQTGNVDILILNASMQTKKPWDLFDENDFDSHISCNVKSSYFIIKQYIEGMKSNRWGRIVTVGSVNQYNNHPELLIYAMTKSAQMKLVQNIAPFVAPYGITVNNISPGAIETPRNDAVLADESFRKTVEATIPVGYVGSPNDINGAAILLCSDEGRYITGSDISVDGGMRL